MADRMSQWAWAVAGETSRARDPRPEASRFVHFRDGTFSSMRSQRPNEMIFVTQIQQRPWAGWRLGPGAEYNTNYIISVVNDSGITHTKVPKVVNNRNVIGHLRVQEIRSK